MPRAQSAFDPKPALPFHRRNDLGFTFAESTAAAAANARARINAHPLGVHGLFSQLLRAYVEQDFRAKPASPRAIAPADAAALSILFLKEPARGEEQAYCDQLLSPSRNDAALYLFDTTWNVARDQHVAELRWLRDERPKTFRMIVTGKLRLACRSIRKKESAELKLRLTEVVRRQAVLLAIHLAHQRIAYLKELAQQPYGSGFAGYRTWLTVGHVLLATIWAPAAIVVEIGTSPLLEPGLDLEEAEQINTAKSRHWIPDDGNGRWLVEQAKHIAADFRLPSYGRHFVRDMLADAVQSALPSATLTRSDLKAVGYSRATFSHLNLGVSVPEACIFVAAELERAFCDIRQRVAGLVSVAPSKQHSSAVIANELIMRTQVLLRAECRPDRHAIDPAAKDALGYAREEVSREDHTGSRALRSLEERVTKDPAIEDRLRNVLGIEIKTLFG